MRTRRGLVVPAVLAALSCATPAIDRPWIEVRSEHFVIWSAVAPERSAEIARDLEGFHRAVDLLTSIDHFEPRVPTRILVLPSPYREMGLSGSRTGFFRQGLRESWAVIHTSQAHPTQTLQHEYVHFLMHNRDGARYPAWFDEGFAEVLATITVEENEVILGLPDPHHEQWLMGARWLPYERILDGDNHWEWTRDDNALFYAQSWALVHYLHFGREGRSFGEDNSRFLKLCEEGQPTSQAFGAAFEIPVRELERRIQRYLERGAPYRRYTLRSALEDPVAGMRPMRHTEVARILGRFQLETDPPAARAHFERALAVQPDDARAHAGLGLALALEGRAPGAGHHLERALELDEEDPLNHLDRARYLTSLARAEHRDEARRQRIHAARRHLERADALAPDTPETYTRLGLLHLLPGEDPAAAIAPLRKARRLLPGNREIGLALGRAYVEAGREETALPLLRQLAAWSHPPSEELLELLRVVEPGQRDDPQPEAP